MARLAASAGACGALTATRSAAVGRRGLLAERLDGRRRVVRAVDRRAGDEHVGAGLGAALDRLRGDAAVDLQPDVEAAAFDQLAGAADLRQHHVEERLAAEARLDGHHQQHVELAEQVGVRLDGGRRAAAPCPARAPSCAELARQPHRGGRRLDVERDAARAGLGVAGRPAVGSSIIRWQSSGSR